MKTSITLILFFTLFSCTDEECKKIILPAHFTSSPPPFLLESNIFKENSTQENGTYYIRYNNEKFCSAGSTFFEGEITYNKDSIYVHYLKVFVDTCKNNVPFKL